MSRIGIICHPATGHMNPMIALGRCLKRHGHEVTFFQIADTEAAVRAAGLGFSRIGERDAPVGTVRRHEEALSRLKGLGALRAVMEWTRLNAQRVLRDAPDAMRALNIDALIVDAIEGAGGSVADFLGIPFVTVWPLPPIRRDNTVPPWIFGWQYRTGYLARLRNSMANALLLRSSNSVRKVINVQRQQWGLRPLPATGWTSTLSQIAQMPQAFDFPGAGPRPLLHYTGPFHDGAGRPPVEFPWQSLNGKPLVYASMGTVFNGIDRAFRIIAEACAALDVQLVLTLGGNIDPGQVGPLAGSPLVVRYAPQLELIKRASLTITHAGLNTTLESLANGVPLVAIPVTADQPGIGARIKWSGTGEVVPLRKLSVARLREAIRKVMEDPSYRAAARRMQAEIQKVDGLERAADLVEQAFGIGGQEAIATHR